MNAAALSGALQRGARNPFRSPARTLVVVVLLAAAIGLLGLMGQAARASRDQIAVMDARVRTLIELREAGAFGTGGFGMDKPAGEAGFSTATLAKVHAIAHARDLVRVDEYVYRPQIDTARKNAYAMLIGLRPGAALRAIGEVDYENARLIAGRGLVAGDQTVAVVGRLYAAQRLGLTDPTALPAGGLPLVLGNATFRVVGVYATGNDFGDNHVFVPLAAFRAAFRPGDKLSKIFVGVDSVAHVERVVADLKRLPEVDVVTTPEAVSTARTSLGSLMLVAISSVALLFAIGAVLIVGVMILATRERVVEIGTFKALGAGNGAIALQFLAEAFTLALLSALGAVPLAAALGPWLSRLFGVPVGLDVPVAFGIAIGAVVFAGLGSLYPVWRGARLSPCEAMRKE